MARRARKDYKFWTSNPTVEIPSKAPGKKGKTPTRLKLDKHKSRARHLRVDELVGKHFEKQHQVRVWRGRYHHMTFVSLATLFMDEIKARHRESAPN